jgi:hypothetical protein
LIYLWKRERIFGACLVETTAVDAHLKFPTGLVDDNRVGQPSWVVNLPYEASIEQLLDFFIDEVLSHNELLPGLLQHRSGIGVDLQMVLNHFPRDPGHLLQLPGKHIDIIPEEGDKCEFLFVARDPYDAGGLGGIRVDLDDLHGDVLTVRRLHVGCSR